MLVATPPDLLQVCSQFRRIINDFPEIQYKIELYVSGYQDNEANTAMGVTTKLESLLAHLRRGERLQKWAWERIELDWDPNLVEASHISGNVWLQYIRPADPPPRVYKVKCVSIENTLDGTPSVTSWTLSFPRFHSEDCVADSSQNTLYCFYIEFLQGQYYYRYDSLFRFLGKPLLQFNVPLQGQNIFSHKRADPVGSDLPKNLSVRAPCRLETSSQAIRK